MITQIDTQNWRKELATGNGQFVVVPGSSSPPSSEEIYVVSNVRADNSFGVFVSDPVPPAPGPGSSFGGTPPTPVATYTFPQPNSDFDPAVALDAGNGLIHIVGTRDTPAAGSPPTSNPQSNDLVKFTYSIATQALTGPVVLSAGNRIRSAYDIAVLPTGHTAAAVSLTDFMQPAMALTNVAVSFGTVTVAAANILLVGQWVTLSGLTTAAFLNGALLQVASATSAQFTASFAHADYASAPDAGSVSPAQSCVLFMELDATDAVVPGSATVLDSSAGRTGNTFDGISLVVDGGDVELYYQSHPKVVTFANQVFSVNLVVRTGGVWGAISSLTTFDAQYSDNRLTVLADPSDNRYLSQTYWTQFSHPEGLVGNVLVGYMPEGGPWSFRATPGSFAGGSIEQSAISVSAGGAASLTYLLEPFEQSQNPPATAPVSFPLHVASIDLGTLGLTDVPGFYNTVNFTWLRGSKSQIDDGSVWAAVGESERTTAVGGEIGTVPAVPGPYTIQVSNHAGFSENVQVTYYPSLAPLAEVVTDPQQGQYTVESSTGLYTFGNPDLGVRVAITYTYVSSILPTYVSLFNVPPVALLSPQPATVWRSGLGYATDISPISDVAVSNSVATVTCNNDFSVGQQVAMYGVAIATFLNGQVLTVASPVMSGSPPTQTGFTAAFSHASYSNPDFGYAAALVPGALTLSAAATTDADNDPIQYVWSENDPDLTDVTLTTAGSQALVNVAAPVGPSARSFDVGVAAIDLYPDFFTQRHPALAVSGVSVSSNILTVTYTAPAGAEVPTSGEQVMPYGVALAPPAAPVVGSVAGSPPYPLPVQNLSVIVTYVNLVGETTGSVNSTITVPAGSLLTVTSPVANGNPLYGPGATGWNVYVGTVGNETLQNNAPIPIGTGYTEPATGLAPTFPTPPTVSAAYQEFVNDQALTLTAVTPTTLVDDSFTHANYTASVTGSVIAAPQFAVSSIYVPFNEPPTVTFPFPQWGIGGSPPLPVLSTTVARNTAIIVTPTPDPSDPLTQFPIVYGGVTDPDDIVTYSWAQTGGSTVGLPSGTAGNSLTIYTGGADVNGETLTFSVTVNDGVNAPVTAFFGIPVAAYTFAQGMDDVQLSRSIFSATAPVTNVEVAGGTATVVANNAFVIGAPVYFTGLVGAAFLNGVAGFTVASVGLFGSPPSQGFTFSTVLPGYPSTPDSGTATEIVPLSLRNTSQLWTPLDISVIYTDLYSIKRNSVLDGSDRYIIISPYSVLVYAVLPNATPHTSVMRKLFTPNQALVLDAVHTEQDYTLVLDDQGNIWRYSASQNINTDDPDTQVVLGGITSMVFDDPDLDGDVGIFTTQSFAGKRVVVLSGDEGALLLQLDTTSLAVAGVLEFTTEDNLLYGADEVQFVRWVNMSNLVTGKVLVGTVAPKTAVITNVAVASNTLTVQCANSFLAGEVVILSGLTVATFLNGFFATVATATSSQFTASYQYAGTYAPAGDTGTAESQTSGTTYETLIDLSQGQIVGTWDKSKLRNQFVQTGEILFDPDSTYSGQPTPPVLGVPTSRVVSGVTQVTLAWAEKYASIVSSYTVQFAVGSPVGFQTLSTVNSGVTQSVTVPMAAGHTYYFRVQANSLDGLSGYSNIEFTVV